MNKTRIEWCDSTWNPVTGCYHNCEYCYARKIANRFGGCDEFSTFRPYTKDWRRVDDNHLMMGEGSVKEPILFEIDKPLFLPRKLDKRATKKHGRQIFDNMKAPYPFGFEPTLHRYRLNDYADKKGRTIFVCSMADLFGSWVPDSWIEEVFAACDSAPQHRYLFLTKNPKRYTEYGVPRYNSQDNFNYWYGVSVSDESNVGGFNYLPAFANIFVSIEPLHEDIAETHNIMFRQVDWFIVGAETGNRKDKVVPKKEWVMNILRECDRWGKPVFMKDSLVPIVGEQEMRRELPWEIGGNRT